MLTRQGVGATGCGSGGGEGVRAGGSGQLDPVLALDELFEAKAAEVVAVQLLAATATDLFDFLVLFVVLLRFDDRTC